MKNIPILLIIGLVLFGCMQQEPVACTADAKICPDGSAVGRNPENNCEFDPCPSFQFCDAATRCETGDCYKFPSMERPMCWQGDNPCVWCGSEECAILESYPMQIVCGSTQTQEEEPPVDENESETEEEEEPPETTDNSTLCGDATAPDDCFYKLATKENDSTYCSSISVQNKSDACYYVIAYQNKDKSNCAKIVGDGLRDQCEHLFTRP